MRRFFQFAVPFLFIALVLTAFAADSHKSLYKQGRDAEARQEYEAAFDFYRQAWEAKPKEVKYRVAMQRTRFLASASYVKRGQMVREQGDLQAALSLFETALKIDPSSFIAEQEVRRTRVALDAAAAGTPPPSTTPPKSPLSKRIEEAEGPVELAPIADTPITLRMTEDTKVIYETIGKLAGINVLFDPDYTPRRIKVDLNGVTLNQALDILALESKTFWRPVTPNTIFVASDTVAKRKELEQNVVKTFYLSNISQPTELQDTVNAIRTLTEITRIQQLPSQSAIVVRGTPDQVALAEKIINDVDRARPEVIVEVAVIQVRRDKLRDLGILPPTGGSIQVVDNIPTTTNNNNNGDNNNGGGGTSNTPGRINLNRLANLNATNFVVTIPEASVNFLFTDSATKVLQNPQIRALDGQKASLKIGDRVPVATGSFQPGIGGVGINPLVNTQFQYIDVGVNIDITPRIHAGREVTLKVMLDISSVTNRVNIGGIDQPVIGQRKIEHDIRLKEGEVNLLGGILEEGDVSRWTGIPGLGQIPFFRYFFAQERKERAENEIVFMLTPRVVRMQELTEMNLRPVAVGTGTSIDLRRASKAPQPAGPQLTPATAPGPVQPQPAPPQGAQLGQPAAVPATQPAPPPPASQLPPPPPQQQPGEKPSPAVTPPAPPGTASFRFDPESVTAAPGATFVLNVNLESTTPIWQVPLQLTYDTSKLQLINISNGGFLSQDGNAVALVHRDDPATGTLQVSATRPPGSGGVSGRGAVLTLTFVAKAPGQSMVSITRPAARDAAQQMLTVSGAQAQVNVQ